MVSSRSTRGAWIEMPHHLLGCLRALVAPHAGAWIEIMWTRRRALLLQVAPHAGAWIEIA